MGDAQFREDDDPPRHDLRTPGPDLLRGWDEAGKNLTAILKDAEARLKLHPDTLLGTSNRFRDIRVHLQVRQTYGNPDEKRRIVNTATRILEQTEGAENPIQKQRFDEALAVLAREEERVFVAVLLGATRDLVYWNWRYGYTLVGDQLAEREARAGFNRDVGKRRLAAPRFARDRYGDLVTDAASAADE